AGEAQFGRREAGRTPVRVVGVSGVHDRHANGRWRSPLVWRVAAGAARQQGAPVEAQALAGAPYGEARMEGRCRLAYTGSAYRRGRGGAGRLSSVGQSGALVKHRSSVRLRHAARSSARHGGSKGARQATGPFRLVAAWISWSPLWSSSSAAASPTPSTGVCGVRRSAGPSPEFRSPPPPASPHPAGTG